MSPRGTVYPSPAGMSAEESTAQQSALSRTNEKNDHEDEGTSGVSPSKAGSDLLAALSFARQNDASSRERFSSDEWSDPREPVLDMITALNDLWVSPLPKDQEASASERSEGVSLPPLLKELLGVEYLPQPGGTNQDNESTSLESLVGNEEEDDVQEDDPAGVDRTESHLSLDARPCIHAEDQESSDFAKKDKKSRRRSLSSSIGKISSKVRKAGERRKQRRRDRVESRDSLTSHGTPPMPPVTESEDVPHRQRAATVPVDLDEAWVKSQQVHLERQKMYLEATQTEIETMQLRIKAISAHAAHVQEEVAGLEASLSESMTNLQQDTVMLNKAKEDLARLDGKRAAASLAVQETTAVIQRATSTTTHTSLDDDPVLNPMLATPRASNVMMDDFGGLEPPTASAPSLRRSTSAAFIRVHDLDMDSSQLETASSVSDLSSHASACCPRGFAFLDDEVKTVLEALMKFGYELATDENKRFTPVLNTEKLLSKCPPIEQTSESWPIRPWSPAFGKEVLVWSGMVDHDGHGCHSPLVKARGILPTAPRNVIDLVLDSSRTHEYNKMSQGRTDVVYLQKGLDTTEAESPYSIAGEAKIIQSINKPPMLRRSIEMLSLLYARPLKDMDGILSVSRSVWEDESGETETSKDKVRSEIMLSVNLLRPVRGPKGEEHCELTTITHVHTSVVPEYLHKKVGPSQAAKFIRELQGVF